MKKKKYDYDLTFEEVLEEIWYGTCWFQGNNFADGTVLYVTSDKELYTKTFSGSGQVYNAPLILTEGVYDQLYRRVFTQPDAERRV